jgi:hypothetical protein
VIVTDAAVRAPSTARVIVATVAALVQTAIALAVGEALRWRAA